MLATNGGEPDAAYKISRYLQDHYDKFTLLISGICKSAGTLIAVGAHELAFSPYGELGPLDIQVMKKDNVSELHSCLNINEALMSLEAESIKRYMELIGQIFETTQGIVSFKTAADAASSMITGLYAPVMAQIDPEELGKRVRSMRIAADYGKRLAARVSSVRSEALQQLAETYPSHGFVIDQAEAMNLFTHVRSASAAEMKLVGALGTLARWQGDAAKTPPVIECLSDPQTTKTKKGATTNAKPKARGKSPKNGRNSRRTTASAAAQSLAQRDQELTEKVDGRAHENQGKSVRRAA